MKKIIIILFLSFIFHSVIAQKSMYPTDTIVVGSIEKSCPGGFTAFKTYIQKNVHPSAIAFENHKVGTTYVSFIIEKDGSVTNVYTILAAGYGMDEGVIKVINNSNNWLPANVDGKPVRSFCRVGIQFLADFHKNSMWVEAKQLD